MTGYTYSPTGALKLSDTTITVSYTEGDVTKTTTQAITVAKALDRIAVTTPPNRTSYFSGEQFSAAGMVVTAYYTDGSSGAVTGYAYSPAGALAAGNTTITAFWPYRAVCWVRSFWSSSSDRRTTFTSRRVLS